MRKMIIVCMALALILALGAALHPARDQYCQPQAAAPGEDGVRPWSMVSALPVILLLPVLRWGKRFAAGKQNRRKGEFCPESGVKSRLF